MAIRISKKCYYALRAVFELARHRTAVPITVAEVADAQGIPPRFLETILNRLRQAGLVVSHRGSAGGYALAVAPEKISVADVIEATQGPISVAAAHDNNHGSKYLCGDAAFDELWANMNATMARFCRDVSLADILRLERRSARAPVPDYTI